QHGAPEGEQHPPERVGRERRHELQVEPRREVPGSAGDHDRTRLLALGAVERGAERLEEGEAHGVHLPVVERDARDVAIHGVDNRVGHGCLSWHLRGVDTKANERRSRAMSAAAALLDRLGRPGDVRLGTAQGEPIRRLPTGLAALDRALRAAEMLLGAGGFGLVALDVGDAGSPGPAPAWPRLARAAERSGTALLVIEPQRRAGTFAALGLEVTGRRARWSGGPGRLVVLDGIDARMLIARNRVGRPGQSLVLRQACA